MAYKISAYEQTILDSIKTDGCSINSQGISVDVNGDSSVLNPYCTNLPVPIKNWDTRVPAGSLLEKIVWDGLRVAALPIVRAIAPFFYSANQIGFTPTITVPLAGATIYTYTIPTAQRLQAPRQAMINLSFTAESDSNNTLFTYWIEVNGIATSVSTYFFDFQSHHESFTTHWIVTIPAGAATFVLKGHSDSGIRNILLDTNDSLSLSIMG